MLEASTGRLVAEARMEETNEVGSWLTGTRVGSAPRLEVREPTILDGRAVIGMFEASAGRLVAVAKMEDTSEEGSWLTGTTGTVGRAPPRLDVTEPRRLDGIAVIGMFDASAGRLVAVAKMEDTSDEGSWLTGTTGTVGKAPPRLDVIEPRRLDGIAVIGMFDASAGRLVAVARMDETSDEGSWLTGIIGTVGRAPIAEVREPRMLDGIAVTGMFDAPDGRLVAVAKMEDTSDEGSWLTGMTGTLAAGVLRRLEITDEGNAVIGRTDGLGGSPVAVARTEETRVGFRAPVGTNV